MHLLKKFTMVCIVRLRMQKIKNRAYYFSPLILLSLRLRLLSFLKFVFVP